MSNDTRMDRRSFFKSAINRTKKEAVKYVDAKVVRAAGQWIRPPFAITELEFLLGCTRCDACIDACPYDVIFPLSAKFGAAVLATPALDLINKGCHLCEDWPCVNACEADVLQLPEVENIATPKLAVAKIDTQACFPYSGPDCGVCRTSCPVTGALTWDMQRPVIDQETCVGCGLCREVCIVEPSAINITALQPT